MNSFREKYQKRNNIKEDKEKDKGQSQVNKTKLSHSYDESKYIKPSSKSNQKKYGGRTMKETPKEENINCRHNNAYIKRRKKC